jgi:hypothetical protein
MTTIRIVDGDRGYANWLLTTAIGSSYVQDWEATALPLWREYAARHEVGIAVVVQDIYRPNELELNGSCQKLLAPRELRDLLGHEFHFALLDTDLFVSPHAPNIFEQIPEGKIGVVSQQVNLPSDVETTRRLAALYRNNFVDPKFPIWSSLNARPKEIFRAARLPEHDDFFCAGMMVGDSRCHAELFVDWYVQIPQSEAYRSVDWGEETWVNHCAQASGEVHWLEYPWHALWIYEVATYYPFLYDTRCPADVAQWCLASSLLRNNFVHLAGSWEKQLLGVAQPRFPSELPFSELVRRAREHLAQPRKPLFSGRTLPSA